MKTLKLIAALMLFAVAAQAQNFGFHINRGMSALAPDYTSVQNSLNQGYGFGAYHVRKMGKTTSLLTGFNLTSLRSTESVMDGQGNIHFIPEKFNYIDLPFLFEKDLFLLSRRMRRAGNFKLQGGINVAYLFHERDMDARVATYNQKRINYAATGGLYFTRAVSWKTEFSIGPQLKLFTTDSEHAKFAGYAGLRVDWRFGK